MKPWEEFKEDIWFGYKGYWCKISKNYLNCLCGYVYVPQRKAKRIKRRIDNIEVYGGITFCHPEKRHGKKYLCIGFDCAHWNDYIPNRVMLSFCGDESRWKDVDFVTKEIHRMVDQIIEDMAKDYDEKH